MKNRNHLLLFFLAIGHGLNDFIAGWMLARSTSLPQQEWNISLFAVYGALAFGGQLPFALIAEQTKNFRQWILLAFVLMLAAVFVFPFHTMGAIILAGIASAIYHVSGGALSILLPEKKGTGAGLFAAPGVLGLAFGGFLAMNSSFQAWFLVPAILLLALPVLLIRSEIVFEKKSAPEASFDRHDGIMLLLLLVIALRSAIWDIWQAASQGNYELIIFMAIAAAAGKILGGILSDRLQQVRFLVIVNALSVLLLQFANRHIAFLLSGILLLQSAIPASVLLVNRLLKGMPAVSNAIVLGLAVVLGSFPYFVAGEAVPLAVAGILILCSAILYGWWVRKKLG